ncbi:MAG: metallophosphoesterase [Synergistaceae bacterium]|nr:metallophosphoesterase [Synergistaceae bacterium]
MIRGVLIFLAVTNVYLYVKLRSGFKNGLWNWIYLLWALLGAILPLTFVFRGRFLGAGREAEVAFALSFTWVAILGMACLGFFFMDAASLGARLADRLGAPNWRARFFDPRKCVPVTSILIAAVVAYSFWEAWNVRRVDLTLETEKLPEGVERLRLVHLTDLHIGGLYTLGRLAKVMDIVGEAQPDLLVMTGDLVDGDMSFRGREAKLLAGHGAKYGAYAVTGNHDFYSGIEQASDFMRRSGFVLLRDARVDVAGLTLIGLEDPAKFGRRVLGPEPLPRGTFFPQGRFTLLLKHRPQVIQGTEGKFDLQLSGHTHGGQIWPFGYLVKWLNGSVQHLSYKGESAVYVSNGAGFWGPPLRFLTPPEVTVIDLVKKSGIMTSTR